MSIYHVLQTVKEHWPEEKLNFYVCSVHFWISFVTASQASYLKLVLLVPTKNDWIFHSEKLQIGS